MSKVSTQPCKEEKQSASKVGVQARTVALAVLSTAVLRSCGCRSAHLQRQAVCVDVLHRLLGVLHADDGQHGAKGLQNEMEAIEEITHESCNL